MTDSAMKLNRTISTGLLLVLIHSVEAMGAGQARLTQVVNQAASSVTISAENTALSGDQSVQLTATVRGVKLSIPTGTIEFLAHSLSSPDTFSSDVLAVSSSGIVTWSTALRANEEYSAVAIYSGDQNFMASVSSAPLMVGPDMQNTVPDFILSGPSRLTVQKGQAVSAEFTIQPVNGFTGAVNLACQTSSSLLGCSIFKSSLSVGRPAMGNPFALQSVPISIITHTTAISTAAGFLLLGIVPFRRQRRKSAVLAALGLLTLLASLAGCGDSFRTTAVEGTPIGSYQVTTTASFGGLLHSQTISVDVTQ
jgi:hypothetical protein